MSNTAHEDASVNNNGLDTTGSLTRHKAMEEAYNTSLIATFWVKF